MKAPFLVVLAAVALGCGSPQPTATLTATGLHDETIHGPFRLTLDLPADTWQAGQPIVGQARLELIQGTARELSGSGGGVIGFSYVEVGGSKRMEAGFDLDCAPWRLSPNEPIATGLQQSGGWSADDPNAAFYRAFVEAPHVALPEGLWDISAVTYFLDGAGCSGSQVQMQTTVRVTITP